MKQPILIIDHIRRAHTRILPDGREVPVKPATVTPPARDPEEEIGFGPPEPPKKGT